MMTLNWKNWSGLFPAKRAARRPQNTISRQLKFEALEDRRVLAMMVTTLSDAPVSGFGQQIGTLRQAIYDANHTPGADIIDFAADLTGTIELTVADDFTNGASALVVSSEITIRGNSRGITISQSDAVGMRLFRVTAAANLKLENLSLTNGNLHADDGVMPGADGQEARGGAIYSQGSVQILNSTFYSNQAVGGNGGPGGKGGSARGGAIYNDAGTLSVANSTFSDNALQSGNGLNGAPSSRGGAIFSRNGSIIVHNSTITNTTAAGTGRGIFISAEDGTASADIWSTIIGQTEKSVFQVEFQAVPASETDQLIITGGNNLIRSQGGSWQITVSTDDPQLGPLQNNGGPTLTHALSAASPAIDMGDNLPGLASDQRGLGFARVAGGAADIGAFELQSGSGPALVGDYNLNQTVDAADYVLWRKTLGEAVAQYADADGNGSGLIDAGDYTAWQAQFGASGVAAVSMASPASFPMETIESGTNRRKAVPVLAAENSGYQNYECALLTTLAAASNASAASFDGLVSQEELLPSAAEGNALFAPLDELFAAFGDEQLLLS